MQRFQQKLQNLIFTILQKPKFALPFSLLLFCFLLFFIFYHQARPQEEILPPQTKYAPSELLIKFKPAAESKLREEEVPTATGIDSIDELNQKYQVSEVKKVVEATLGKGVKGAKTGQKSLSLLRKIKLGGGAEVEKALSDYQADPNVLYVEPNYLVKIALTPNDPYYNSTASWGQAYDDLWGLKKINTSAAWDIETGASNEVVVAVIDTGIDYLHPDLAGNTWVNSDEIPDNGLDDDNNGYVDDYYGYDFFNEDGDPFDDHWHGTHVAGTISAVTNNGIGVAGVSWGASIMGVKFLGSGGWGWVSDAISAITYATDNGAKVLNNSWGGSGYSQALQEAIDYADAAGAVFVAAAGNSNKNAATFYPAAMAHVLAVAATDTTDIKASFSNYGSVVDISAPGVDILSVRASGTYARVSGTSVAAPYAAGVAALVWAKNPTWTNTQVETQIIDSADDIDELNPSYAGLLGSGRVNADLALKEIGAAPAPTSTPIPTVTPTPLPTSTPTPTLTPTLTSTPTPTMTPTPSSTSTPTPVFVPQAAATATPIPTSMPTPTPTPVPTPTPTLTPAPSYTEATEGKATPAKMGDVNLDSKVDIFDLSRLLSKWGKSLDVAEVDLNKDSKVDIFDLSVLLSNWGK